MEKLAGHLSVMSCVGVILQFVHYSKTLYRITGM